MAGATLIAPPQRLAESGQPDPRSSYSCSDCGQLPRVFGRGRHRVYLELADDRRDDPVVNRVCPRCGRGCRARTP